MKMRQNNEKNVAGQRAGRHHLTPRLPRRATTSSWQWATHQVPLPGDYDSDDDDDEEDGDDDDDYDGSDDGERKPEEG